MLITWMICVKQEEEELKEEEEDLFSVSSAEGLQCVVGGEAWGIL